MSTPIFLKDKKCFGVDIFFLIKNPMSSSFFLLFNNYELLISGITFSFLIFYRKISDAGRIFNIKK